MSVSIEGGTMRQLLLAVCLSLGFVAGCHSGDFSRTNVTETVLQGNNYRVVMSGVQGVDSGFKVFGLGGSALYAVCLEKIRVQAQLDDRSRALVNVTQDLNFWNIGIAWGETLTITADIIEFTGPPTGGE
jgi:hypothetical protein